MFEVGKKYKYVSPSGYDKDSIYTCIFSDKISAFFRASKNAHTWTYQSNFNSWKEYKEPITKTVWAYLVEYSYNGNKQISYYILDRSDPELNGRILTKKQITITEGEG